MSSIRISGDITGAVELSANAIAGNPVVTLPSMSGTMVVAPPSAVIVNGAILVGNTVSNGYDQSLIAQTAPIIVTNSNGTINLSHSSSGVVAATYGNATSVPSFTVDSKGHISAVTETPIVGGSGTAVGLVYAISIGSALP
jgi:hypothetical protein